MTPLCLLPEAYESKLDLVRLLFDHLSTRRLRLLAFLLTVIVLVLSTVKEVTAHPLHHRFQQFLQLIW
jgi:hypothetical protein